MLFVTWDFHVESLKSTKRCSEASSWVQFTLQNRFVCIRVAVQIQLINLILKIFENQDGQVTLKMVLWTFPTCSRSPDGVQAVAKAWSPKLQLSLVSKLKSSNLTTYSKDRNWFVKVTNSSSWTAAKLTLFEGASLWRKSFFQWRVFIENLLMRRLFVEI